MVIFASAKHGCWHSFANGTFEENVTVMVFFAPGSQLLWCTYLVRMAGTMPLEVHVRLSKEAALELGHGMATAWNGTG
jgi:hypothetical protein